jgi:hypothetical protein
LRYQPRDQVHPNGFADHVTKDVTLDAYMRRMDSLEKMLLNYGKFSRDAAVKALVNSDPATKEAVAAWLRIELDRLRKAEAKLGTAPVRRKLALSRLDIADAALTMVQAIKGPCGNELLSLLQELLNVDRHRQQLFRHCSDLFEAAANFDAQLEIYEKNFSARELAKRVGVSQPTISAWRKSAQYKEMVALYRDVWQEGLEPIIEQIKAKNPGWPREQLVRSAFEKQSQEAKKVRAQIFKKGIARKGQV